MISVFDHRRPDPSPRPDLPILMIVANNGVAETLQRHIHPSQIFFVAVGGGPLMGRRFRQAIASDGAYRKIYEDGSRAEREDYHRFIDEHVRTRIAPGCPQEILYV